MAIKPIEWLVGEGPAGSFVDDLRQGRTGAPARILMSLAAAALTLAPAMLVLGLIEVYAGRADDFHIGIALAVAALAWGVALVFLWWHYRRLRHVIRPAVGVLTVWAVAVPSAVAVENAVPRADYLIVSVILSAAGATLVTIALAISAPGSGAA